MEFLTCLYESLNQNIILAQTVFLSKSGWTLRRVTVPLFSSSTRLRGSSLPLSKPNSSRIPPSFSLFSSAVGLGLTTRVGVEVFGGGGGGGGGGGPAFV